MDYDVKSDSLVEGSASVGWEMLTMDNLNGYLTVFQNFVQMTEFFCDGLYSLLERYSQVVGVIIQSQNLIAIFFTRSVLRCLMLKKSRKNIWY